MAKRDQALAEARRWVRTVCECSHVTSEHHQGETFWTFAGCAVEGCACQKFLSAKVKVTRAAAVR